MALARLLAVLLVLAGFCSRAENLEPKIVMVPFRNLTIRCFLYTPGGKGPFPTMIWNHGNDKTQFKNGRPFLSLAEFYTRHGYALFIPWRLSNFDLNVNSTDQTELFLLQTSQIRAAINSLKAQSVVNEFRLVMSGQASGGVASLFCMEQEPSVQCCIAFSPGSMSWGRNPPVDAALLRAVRNAKAPLFIAQATNDFSLEGTTAMGRELQGKDKLNRVKIYPPFGKSVHAANAFGADGVEVWGSDALKFLDEVLP